MTEQPRVAGWIKGCIAVGLLVVAGLLMLLDYVINTLIDANVNI